jgi:serine/threonine-protein kinase HipA
MSDNRCLYCYRELPGQEVDFHSYCSKKIFGKSVPPLLPYTENQMLELAEKVIKSHKTVTGVQPKLSLEIEKISVKDVPARFTIVGLWGKYILKPPTQQYPYLPELEDLTMHLAELAGINIVPHSLIRLKSGKLSYITKRVDREGESKIHMEDMCQLTGKLTENKYRGSYEQIGKVIINYSENPGLDIIGFFEQVIFSFLTGNADMHLKNFSLLDIAGPGYSLCPAYDMVPSALLVAKDSEELALTLNGKKKKLKRRDFTEAIKRFDIDSKSIENIFQKFETSFSRWYEFINIGFIPDEIKTNYISMIKAKGEQIGFAIF